MEIKLETKVRVFYDDCNVWHKCKGQNGSGCYGCNGHHNGILSEKTLLVAKMDFFVSQYRKTKRELEVLSELNFDNELDEVDFTPYNGVNDG